MTVIGFDDAPMPTKVRLMGQTITIAAVEPQQQMYAQLHRPHASEQGGLVNLGTTEITVQRVAIRKGQAFHQERSTLLHEMLHVIEGLTGHSFNGDWDSPEGIARHALISAYETGLLDLLRGNPDLVTYLTEAEPA